MSKAVLIIGEETRYVDFAAAKPGTTPESIMSGLNASIAQLKAAGHRADLLLTDDGATAADVVTRHLRVNAFDVIVIGAGLRVLPGNTLLFEKVMNAVHAEAPHAKLAFNEAPDDSARAAMRLL